MVGTKRRGCVSIKFRFGKRTKGVSGRRSSMCKNILDMASQVRKSRATWASEPRQG